MTTSRPDPASDAALETAMDWLLRLDAAPEDDTLRAGLADWLAVDSRHAKAWQQAQHAWHLVGEVPPRFVAAPATPALPAPLPRPSSWRRRARRLATAAVAAGLLLALLPSMLLQMKADYVSGTGEQQRITLNDGSVVYLGAASAIAIDLKPEARHVTLLRGEAFFEVAPDKARPFTVTADTLDVTVLGTAFDVRRGDGGYTVGVEHGAVRVHQDGHALTDRLLPGQQLAIQEAAGAALHTISPQDVGAWREGRLFVQDATVRDVVSVLQRYLTGHIAVVDRDVASRRVTGIYDLNDPERALAALVAPQRGQVRKLTPLLYIVSAR